MTVDVMAHMSGGAVSTTQAVLGMFALTSLFVVVSTIRIRNKTLSRMDMGRKKQEAYYKKIEESGAVSDVPILEAAERAATAKGDGVPSGAKSAPAGPVTGAAGASGRRMYTIEEVRKHNTEADCWIVVDNMVLNVTKWLPSHPGGSKNISALAGRDVTELFHGFHPRYVRGLMINYQIGNLANPVKPSKFTLAYRALRQEIVDAGLFEVDQLYSLKMLLKAPIPLACAVLYGLVCMEHTWFRVVFTAVFMGLYWQQIAFLAHDAGHNNVTHRNYKDFFMGCWMSASIGISIGWWKDSHNTHHVVTNSIQYDPDIQHLPFMAVSDRYFTSQYSTYHRRVMVFDAFGRFLVSIQHYIYYLIMSVARFFLYFQSFVFVFTKDQVQERLTQLMVLLFFWTWFILLAIMSFDTHASRLGFVLLAHAISGILHVQITLSHFAMETYDDVRYRDDVKESFFATQLATTMNVDCHPLMDWFHGGLQFQTEHHLFPRLPRHSLRAARPYVEKWAKKVGLHYHSADFFNANVELINALADNARKCRALPRDAPFDFWGSMLGQGIQMEG